MFSKKKGVTIGILGFCLFASTGCQLLFTAEQRPSDQAPLYFYIAVDNSVSYGMSKSGKRNQNQSVQKVFDDAKYAVYKQLINEEMFQEGDYLVGISPFTDEKAEEITNYLTGDPVEIRSNNLRSLTTSILDNFDKIKLRPVKRGQTDYKTYYRNVLDRARSEFGKSGAAHDQQVAILLTDERGGEIEGPAELPPEKYSFYYVIKLEAKAVGNGTLTITPNDKLAEFASQKDAPIAEYVAAIRDKYKRDHQIPDKQFSLIRLILTLLGLTILGFVWVRIAKSLGRDWSGRRQAPSLTAVYNPGTGRIFLQPERFQLPGTHDKYWLDKGGDLKNLQGNWLEPQEPLPSGRYEITVQPEKGPLVKGDFIVRESIKAAPSLTASYKSSDRLLFLQPHNCHLPPDKDRYDLGEPVEIESVDVDAGKIVFAQPLRPGRHTLTVHLEDGKAITTFVADPPPPPKPRYSISIARLNDFDNPKTVELTGREINLLDKERLKASIWVKRDDHYLYIRTAGNVQKEDGMPIIGNLQLSLDEAISAPISLALEDDREDVEIKVQQV